MCNITSGYFTVNGNRNTCNAGSNDTVNVACDVSFSAGEGGISYKAELKIQLPTGAYFSFFTPLMTTVIGQTSGTFISEPFIKPVPAGTYTIVWFVIYNASGNTICSSNGQSGTGCKSITATTSQTCTQQDNSFLVNGKSSLIVKPGDLLTASVRSTTAYCLGITPKWRIVAISGNPIGVGDIRVDNGVHVFDANGCGSTSFVLNVIGTYTLVCRWCCAWSGAEHCLTSDSDLPNTVIVKVQETIPPSGGGCDPATCPSDKNLCILGNCVPKNYLFIGAAGFLLLMMMGGRD
ncbi:MAG: hypothetical protein PHP08_00345 [Candidatus Dojkabacteria bacterium]|nr:hypothetical protein [Candidatus Dojkabacteria bacterium]